MYKLGLMVIPVCPTCSEWGLQSMSLTGFEQAVAAPNESASSSIIPQFSGPFIPRPADTTNSASVNVILPAALVLLTIVVPVPVGLTLIFSSAQVTLFSFKLVLLGVIAITFLSEFKATLANPFPEKTPLLTANPFALSA